MLPLAITLGDPAGVGPEVVEKALREVDVPARTFGAREPRGEYGIVSAENGRAALDAIEQALDAIERGECSALVNAPIHKQSIALAGCRYPGHTELLAARAGRTRYAHDYAMYFDSPSLRVALLTVHEPLWSAIRRVNGEDIAALTKLTAREYARFYGAQPRIGVAAMNPHGGEGGKFGDEEEEILRGVEIAKRAGVDASGPWPADTLFLAAREGKYDVVVAMYHDQGLIPIKMLAFATSVNVTIGLPYLRVSVDHGTAFDIAGKGIADAAPMRYAIEWAARHAEKFTS
jgi:4-hydroxythreonine-4-phosphate dehydrogenase